MKKFNGFTLIELLVTVSIIAVLVSIAVIYYGNTQKSARDGKRKSDLEQVRAALEMYRSQEGSYPSGDWSNMMSEFQSGGYINQEPEDPRSPKYSYYYSSDGQTYTVCAYLESEDLGECGSNPCGDEDCNFQVTNP